MQIGFVNHATHLKSADLALIASAINSQMRLHAAPAWDTTPATIGIFQNETRLPANVRPIVAFDNADQAGALGYHDVTPDGRPYGKVFVQTVLDDGGSILTGDLSVSVTFSHEALELWMDQFCNSWAQGPDGTLHAIELGDPVEADSYNIIISGKYVSLSNFVWPEWFNAAPNLPTNIRFDQMKHLKAPFTMSPNGYMIVQTGGQTSAVYGEKYDPKKLERKLMHPSNRTMKRGVTHLVPSVPTKSPATAPAAQ